MKPTINTLLLALFVPTLAFAQSTGIGGGDLCKNEIDRHRAEIKRWIESDQASELNFSKAQVQGLTYSGYKSAMLKALEPGKVVVTCYRPSERAITIGEGQDAKPTTCINYEDQAGISHIDCNYDLILNESAKGNPNYVLTHHEFASIAKVEARTNSFVSDFSISNQISEFEQWVQIKVLGKRQSTLPVIQPGQECTLSLVGASKKVREQLDGAIIRGYRIVQGEDGAFRLKLEKNKMFGHYHTDNFQVISHHDYDGLLSHRSGFSVYSKERVCKGKRKTEAHTRIHPDNETLLMLMRSAPSISEYERLKAQYNPSLDQEVEAGKQTLYEMVLNSLPTCGEALKSR